MEELEMFKPDVTNRNIELRKRLLAVQMHFCYGQRELSKDMKISNVTLRSFAENKQDAHIKTLAKINKYVVRKEAEMNTLPIEE